MLPGLGFSPDKCVGRNGLRQHLVLRDGLVQFRRGVPLKIFAGYEHISYANPSSPLPAGFDDIGGYKLAFVNNAAFPNDKILQVYWAGVKYTHHSER